ncbi:nitroreductase/quinone reductase family protein [Amycolatopsis benzoatilytica]|uniref:nitroreductase/quinone reductase family protein n=1 Tax=Amycolatopsis benzoatilytica TaxID=346045 RepID=UPI000375D449|nr:nitroreductase/quinone reductase family protein [Amycolatopsis benzoatilytica]
MSFDTHAGHRGSRLSSGPVMRWLDNRMTSRVVRKAFSTFFSFDALVLTTVGAKSGIERKTVVCWFPGKDDSYLIVAAAGGTAGNPAWYYNVAAHPDRVEIEIDGTTIPVTAEQLHGAERADAWRQITAAAHRFARFQQHTDRELPVLRLTRRSGPRPEPSDTAG